jgi:multiple sugar transport system substrate-binding protein
VSGRKRRGLPWRRSRGRDAAAGIVCAALACGALAGCAASSAAAGPVTLNFYQYPDSSGATNQEIQACNAQARSQYVISYQQLPTDSDSQRQQLARRLSAKDASIDIMGLDVTWEAEFAQAGWILPWTGRISSKPRPTR